MNKKIKIEVWTDIMCPYCHIGKIHYEQALKQFKHADEVELTIKAFQLNPRLPDKGNGYPVVDYLRNNAEIPENKIEQMFSSIEQLANEVKVKVNLYNAFAANTLDTHRLIKLAAKYDLAPQVLHLLSKAYFEDAKDYSDVDFLIKTAIEAGLNEDEVRKMLVGDDYKKAVTDDMVEATQLGIDTVPSFLFNRKRALIGAEPVDAFLEIMNACYSDSPTDKKVSKGKSCNADGVCEI